jgi:hypothetical protein
MRLALPYHPRRHHHLRPFAFSASFVTVFHYSSAATVVVTIMEQRQRSLRPRHLRLIQFPHYR